MIQAIVFLPLLAAIIAGFGGRIIGVRGAQLVTTGFVFISAILSWIVFFEVALGPVDTIKALVLPWIESGDLRVDWMLRVDTLTAVMFVVVNTVAALVHLYSIGYMEEDPHKERFMAYLSLFTFAMLMLVTADNLVQMFFGWEGVGLASYLLIGFWYEKPSANAAAMKAFIVNRVGDFGFSLGIFATFFVFGSVQFDDILPNVGQFQGMTIDFLGAPVDVMTLICLLLFVGAMGKSAQLGLHTWLPDAMEGPTPVSALIHAATMVTAGVFMLARLSPMFEAAPAALYVVTLVGAATAFFAATIGVVQNDIKRVIAYSTCSQLGYMFFALGVGAYGAAIFHLFTHAFFKALLFLGAGSVIHAMHHEQDMRYYGGLARAIPLTTLMMFIGTIALTGFPFTAGYYSKDAILESAWISGMPGGNLAFFLGICAAFLTSFYSWRLMFMTFAGPSRWHMSPHQHHTDDPHHEGQPHPHQPHESPWTMLVPLIVLSLGALGAGALFYDQFVGAETGGAFWAGSLMFNEELMEAIHHVPALVKWAPAIVMALGFTLAYILYVRAPHLPPKIARTFRGAYLFLLNKWYFDELYHLLFVRPSFWFGRLFWKRGDEQTIDRFGPDGVAGVVANVAVRTRKLQSGYLYSYAFAMLIGVAAALTWFITRAGG